jgi:ribosomal protein S2
MSTTMREMLEATLDCITLLDPKMAPYIFGHRNRIHHQPGKSMFQDAMKVAKQLSAAEPF